MFLFDWPEFLIWAFQNLRLRFRRDQSLKWPETIGTVQPFQVKKGYGFWAPNCYRSILGYAYKANESRYASFFVLQAPDKEAAELLQKKAEGAKVTVRYNPANPDVSLVRDELLFGLKIDQNPHWLP